jgi:putative nucleotidyltransferase with HDIG domain
MLKKIFIDEVEPGMQLVDSGLSFEDHPALYLGNLLIQSESQIHELRRQGYLEFFIDTARGMVSHFREQARFQKRLLHHGRRLPAKPAEKHAAPLKAGLGQARRVYRRALDCVRNLLKDASRRELPDCAAVLDHVSAFLHSLNRNPHALLSLTRLARREPYALTHSVNVTVLSLIFGRSLGLNVVDLQHLGAAALLHDVGKAQVPRKILRKRAPLDSQELAVAQRHPVHGYRMLKKGAGLPEAVLTAVLDHHEKHDGSGYPRALAGSDISQLARVVALADVYDALTSDKSYGRNLPPDKAMAEIFRMRGRAFQPDYAERFIKRLGLYPVGAFVRLTDGVCAVVVDQNPSAPLRPKVRVVMDRRMRRVIPFTVDLQQEKDRGGLAVCECTRDDSLGLSRLIT